MSSSLLRQRYRLLKETYQGNGKTFLAVDEGQFPAVPCVVQQFWWKNQFIDAWVEKAQKLEQLGKHPQIPALLAYFEDNQYFYLVQEFIEGTHLASLINETGAFSESQIWQLLENLLPVIQYIHAHNIIHCDIKPENIIQSTASTSPVLNKELGGNLVLVGFGYTQLTTALNQFPDKTISGSPEYAASEQLKGKPTFASDLYSLGVACIHLLTQIPPFDLFDVANDCWVWQQYLTTRVSEKLSTILDKLVQKNINHRFQSANEVIQALGLDSPSPSVPPLPHSPGLWRCFHTLSVHAGMSSGVNSIAINSSPPCDAVGEILASAHDDKTIKLWDLNSKQLISTLIGHSQAVKSVAFSPDGQLLASGSDDKTIKLWDVNTLKEICTLSGHSHAVKSVAFSPCHFTGETSVLLASGSWDKTVKLWDVKTASAVCTLSGHQLQVSAGAFSPQGEILASASLDRTIRLWRMREFKNRPYYTLSSILLGHAWAVLTVAFSPDGKVLATGSDDNTIKLWDVNTGQVIATLSGHSWSVTALAFSTDGETLMSGSRDNTIKLWRVNTKEEIATLSSHVDTVSAIAVSPVAQLIASGSRDKTIKLWELVQ